MSGMIYSARRSGDRVTVTLYGRQRAERHARGYAEQTLNPGESLTLDVYAGRSFLYKITPAA